MDVITREIPDDIRTLRDDELGAVTGGADTQTEQKTLNMLSSMVSTVIKTTGVVLGTAIR